MRRDRAEKLALDKAQRDRLKEEKFKAVNHKEDEDSGKQGSATIGVTKLEKKGEADKGMEDEEKVVKDEKEAEKERLKREKEAIRAAER